MGDVYLARDERGRTAAVKIVRPDLMREPAFRIRFAREVAVCRRVTGPGVARFLGADLDGPEPWLATEYVRGPTLAEHVAAVGPMRGPPLTTLARGLAESLARIHAAGITHRDLKPGNVILAADLPVVIDFGIAAAYDVGGLTSAGMIVGSPGWLAPEQVRGERVGAASDVFAWGGTVAFAGTGRAPFGDAQPDVLLYRVVHAEPDLTGLDDPTIRPLVAAALAKEPARRPTVDGLRRALAGGATREPTVAVDRTRVYAPPPPPPPPSVVADGRGPVRRRWWVGLVIVALLATSAGGAYGVTRFALSAPGQAAPTTTPSTTPSTTPTTQPAAVAPTTAVSVTPTTTAPSSAPPTTSRPVSPATTVVLPAASGGPAAPMPEQIQGYVPYGGAHREQITVTASGEPVSPGSFVSRNDHCADILWTARWHMADTPVQVAALREPNEASWSGLLDLLFDPPRPGAAAAAGYLSGSICDRPAFVWFGSGRVTSRADVIVDWQYWRAKP
jgi:serine/threonine protein kinase